MPIHTVFMVASGSTLVAHNGRLTRQPGTDVALPNEPVNEPFRWVHPPKEGGRGRFSTRHGEVITGVITNITVVQGTFTVPEDDEFERMLDEPPKPRPKLASLFGRPQPFAV